MAMFRFCLNSEDRVNTPGISVNSFDVMAVSRVKSDAKDSLKSAARL